MAGIERLWERIAAALGSEVEARERLVAAAVATRPRESRTLDRGVLAVLEQSSLLRSEPHVALSFALEGVALWSVVEARCAADVTVGLDDPELLAETIREEATALATADHVRRLELLVARVRAELPLPRQPAASGALAGACDAFESERDERAGLAALLLGQGVGAYRRTPIAA